MCVDFCHKSLKESQLSRKNFVRRQVKEITFVHVFIVTAEMENCDVFISVSEKDTRQESRCEFMDVESPK